MEVLLVRSGSVLGSSSMLMLAGVALTPRCLFAAWKSFSAPAFSWGRRYCHTGWQAWGVGRPGGWRAVPATAPGHGGGAGGPPLPPSPSGTVHGCFLPKQLQVVLEGEDNRMGHLLAWWCVGRGQFFQPSPPPPPLLGQVEPAVNGWANKQLDKQTDGSAPLLWAAG